MRRIRIVLLVFCLSSTFFACTTAQRDGVYKEYYSTGVLKHVQCFNKGVLDGITREYGEDGILQKATNYENNKVEGMRNIYYPDGSLWTKEVYSAGKLVARKEFDEEGFVTSEQSFE